MAEYFASFRVASVDLMLTETERRQSIYDAVKDVTAWGETTSFLVFRADADIVEVLRVLTRFLNPQHDMMVLRQVGFMNTVYWGAIQDENILRNLVPDARRIRF